MAVGTQEKPITFTSFLPERFLPNRGTWGGLILLGKATIAGLDKGKGFPEDDVEGLGVCDPSMDDVIERHRYGGLSDEDSSGTLKVSNVRNPFPVKNILKRSDV